LLALLASSVATAQSAVTTLGVDGRTNANPSVAVNGTFVAVAWSAATVSSMDIYLATSRDGGKTFAAPVRVNGIDGDARVNGEMPPRVVLVPKPGATPQIVVVWTAKHGANYAILSSRSTDGGRTFSSAVDVPGSAADGNRGWESVTADDAGHVYALWLDHRALAADMAHAHDMAAKNPTSGPAPKPDPTERAGLSHLYFSSLDGKRATVITNSVCYCCKTSLVSAGNNIYAVWRHVYPGSMRDMAFSMSTDRGRTFSSPVRVSEDKWQIDGCPDNGPSLAVDSKKRVHIAWPTAADSKDPKALAVFYATSADGKAFSARAKVPSQGPAQHPQIVVGRDGVPIVAWDETVDGTRRLGFARVSVGADGKATFTTIPSPDAGPGQWYPSLAATGTGAIAAWVRQRESGSAIAVSSLR
jgi:hypothetical protein